MVKPGLKPRVTWICGGACPAGHPSHSHRHNPCLLPSAEPLTFNSVKLKDLKEPSKNGRKLLLIMISVWVVFTMFTFREKNWTIYLPLQGIGSLCAVHSPSVMSSSLRLMNCSPPGSSVHGHSSGKNTGVGCHAFLQGIFPAQGSSRGLPHCRRILYHLSALRRLN